jgi:hypothetical protein
LVKAVLPAGFMLAERNDHTIAFVMCNNGAPIESVLDLRTGEVTPKQDKQGDASHDAPCAFTAIAVASPPGGASLAAPLLIASTTNTLPPRALRPHVSEIGPPLAARGPPTQA